MGIANQTNTKGGWMAWLPIFNVYLIGKLAFNKTVGWIIIVLTFLGDTGELTVNGENEYIKHNLNVSFVIDYNCISIQNIQKNERKKQL